MRRKLTTTICTLGVLGIAGAALAAEPIAVAIFPFNDASEMDNFTQVKGTKCAKKLRASKAMGINIGEGNSCVFRTSVVADSSDTSPSQDIQASVAYEGKTPKPLQGKMYLSVLVRASASSGYELRLIPAKQRWIVIRDGEGAVGETTLGAGTGKFIKPAPKKLNVIRLLATASGTNVGISAIINNRTIFSTTDIGTNVIGRFTEIGVGNKTGAAGVGMLGTFDNVTVRIPAPF